MNPVSKILFAHQVDMGGFPVRQPLPTSNVDQVDPFLLLHHHTGKVEAGSDHKNTGVGPHPHRGFSPVTFIFNGSVHHRDSRGNATVVSAGGVQWMNAGMGIIHSERPSKKLAEMGGIQEIIQLWINTPAANKMDQPGYHAVQNEEIPRIQPQSGSGFIQVISGSTGGTSGVINTQHPITTAMGLLESGAIHEFKVDQGMNTLLYLLDGQIRVKGHGLVDGEHLIVFKKDIMSFQIEALNKTRLLFLSGKPIEEPLKQYGPYVMNSQSEILKAMRDYQMGKMGVLIEEFD